METQEPGSIIGTELKSGTTPFGAMTGGPRMLNSTGVEGKLLGFSTEILTVSGSAVRFGGTVAQAMESLSTPVSRVEPFHWSAAPETKPEPLAQSVIEPLPAGVFGGKSEFRAGAGSGSRKMWLPRKPCHPD